MSICRARDWRPGVWTLENYTRIVTDDYYREVIWRTLGLGLFVTLACLLLGYPLAYLIARGPERWRVPLILLVDLSDAAESRRAFVRLDRAARQSRPRQQSADPSSV